MTMPIRRHPHPRRAALALAAAFASVAISGCTSEAGGPPRAAAEAALKPAAQTRAVAVTFDDLPAVSQEGRDVATHARITRELLRTIRENRVPAIGFVNESKLLTDGRVDERRVELLRHWVNAGLELGNHGYLHKSMHNTPLAEYQADMARGDSVTRLLVRGAGAVGARFYRHPFLHAGRDLNERRVFEGALRERGYRVAPVTIDNGDYLFAAAYDLAGMRGDSALRARVADTYVAYMDTVFGFYERQSVAILGREIPQVLLLHANQINADHFGRLADMMRRRGYTFVPMHVALADPAYQSEDTYTGPGGITWLHRWALTRGMPGSTFAGEPEVPEWVRQAAARPRP